MRKYITVFALAFIGVIAFFSCKKSDNNSTPGTGNTTSSITATINGTAFSGTYCVGANPSDSTISIIGATSLNSYPAIYLNIFSYKGTGTYAISSVAGSSSISPTAYLDSSTAATYNFTASSGSITIKTFTASAITGTFNFTCSDGTQVTNGSFTASLK
jgi:hypothetical protein